MSESQAKLQILVLGSMCWENVLIPSLTSEVQERRSETSRGGARWIGAPMVRTMIRHALSVPSDIYPAAPKASDRRPNRAWIKECGEITAAFRMFPKNSFDGKKVARVLRVQNTHYVRSETIGNCMSGHLRTAIEAAANPDVLALYDQDPHFRLTFETALKDERIRSLACPTRALIIASADTIDEKWVLTILGKFQDAPSRHRNTVVLLTADGLRKRGLNIVEVRPLEQTIKEVVKYTKRLPLRTILDACGHLIILFDEIGAIYIRRDDDRGLGGSIHFCPSFDRVAQVDPETYGRSPGRTAIALTSIVKEMAELGGVPQTWDLAAGVRLGVVAYNLYFSKGFNEENPFQALETSLGKATREELKSLLETKREFAIASLPFPMDKTLQAWSRVNGILRPNASDQEVAERLLHKIVKAGLDTAVSHDPQRAGGAARFPQPKIDCPVYEVGKVKSVDPGEIAGLLDLAKLIRKYLRDGAWDTPLSIAVFGPPGSGKSFVVKELLKTVDPASGELPALTYNLAQFDSVASLTEAFHQVQDRALSSDAVPLVIFDEFDAEFKGKLGWLKFFLAPMQDGRFRGQSADYRVGRAIFLFAGGTSESFKQFKQRSDLSQAERKAVKLTDFISRLKGHLNVLDINPPRRTEARDQQILRTVRRAIILRYLLQEYAKPVVKTGPNQGEEIAEVDETVIDAFLNVLRYEHGVRSMEAVVRMSMAMGGRLMPSSLPSKEQLDMHAAGFWPLDERRISGRPRTVTSSRSPRSTRPLPAARR